jgi:hypothetical protein
MTAGFVAVVRTNSTANAPALLAAGAIAVLSWAELATSTEPDDVPAVLFDLPDLPELPDVSELPDRPDALERSNGAVPISGLAADLAAVLRTLTSVDPIDDSTVVIATVRPVIDTLKLVDGEGVLTGTAERDEHRFVGTPIAARLRLLRAVSRELECVGTGPGADDPRIGPTPVAVLAALATRGATVLSSR